MSGGIKRWRRRLLPVLAAVLLLCGCGAVNRTKTAAPERTSAHTVTRESASETAAPSDTAAPTESSSEEKTTGATEEPQTEPAVPAAPVFPEQALTGGYELETPGAYFRVLVEEGRQYLHYQAKDSSRELILYCDTEETILIERTGEQYFYRIEGGVTDEAENPLEALLLELRQKDFRLLDLTEDSITYLCTEAYRVEKQALVRYSEYQIELVWKDGNTYVFQLFDFEDGGRLLSAAAPEEINPYFTENCTWELDPEKGQLRDSVSGETFRIGAVLVSTGSSYSILEKEEKEYETVEEQYYLTSDRQGKPEILRHESSSLTLNIRFLWDAVIQKPAAEPDWGSLEAEALQQVLFLLGAFSALY